jgi:hypothetical protein
MIQVSDSAMQERAKSLPVGYLEECRKRASIDAATEHWCFELADYLALKKKYDRYSVSEADPYRSRISGCCDRADQY